MNTTNNILITEGNTRLGSYTCVDNNYTPVLVLNNINAQ